MRERQGCAMTMALLVGCALIWFLVAYGVFKLGSMAIEALIPDADAVEVAARTTKGTNSPTTTGTKVVGEFVGESPKVEGEVVGAVTKVDAKVTKVDAKIESTVQIPALPQPTIGEVDAEAEENRLIEEALLARSHKIEDCLITYYCCEKYPHICGTGDGLTALGGEVLPGVSCAVPPEIPLGSTVMIDWGEGNIEYRRADDRGDAVRGDHIDLAVQTHKEALELGVKYATVYWCEE